MISNRKMVLSAILGSLAGITFFFLLIALTFSIIKIILLILTAIGFLVFLLPIRKIKNIAKYCLVILMIFSIAFASVELYLFRNTNVYPSYLSQLQPPSPKINISLTQTIQDIEQSPSFALIRIEHPGDNYLQTINLNDPIPNFVSATYFFTDPNVIVSYDSTRNQSYRVTVTSFSGPPSMGMLYPKNLFIEALKQIDDLGINWFYESALKIANNSTTNGLHIDGLSISIQYETYSDYQGITVLLKGYTETYENGYTMGHSVLIADFQANGTLLYLNIPK